MQFIDSGMYMDVEEDENVDEDFLSALALLHSSDESSAAKLGDMLSALINKKFVKTSVNLKKNYSIEAAGIVSEFEDQIKLMEISRKHGESGLDNSSFSSGESIVDSLGSSEISTTDESFEDEDIPRISIPDVATSDDAVCRICNGDKIGPLILLECQDCQDSYHPLCHHPPVVDIDVYDPRLVWRCGKCLEKTELRTAPLTVSQGDRIDAFQGMKKKSSCRVNSKMSSRIAKEKLWDDKMMELNRYGRNKSRPENHGNFAKRIPGVTHKNSSVSLRKRVGSRLSVTRASPAK